MRITMKSIHADELSALSLTLCVCVWLAHTMHNFRNKKERTNNFGYEIRHLHLETAMCRMFVYPSTVTTAAAAEPFDKYIVRYTGC